MPQVLDGLKVGNAALKKANDMFSIDEIEQIMDDTQEGIEKQREIDSLLSGELTDEDEADVLRELEELVNAEEEVEVEEDVRLPDVPTDALPGMSIDGGRAEFLLYERGIVAKLQR